MVKDAYKNLAVLKCLQHLISCDYFNFFVVNVEASVKFLYFPCSICAENGIKMF